MGNAVDYISWRGDLSFEDAPINEVDIFIFSQIVAANYTGIIEKTDVGITLKEAAERYFETHSENRKSLGVLQSGFVLPVLKAMSVSERYKNLLLKRYINKIKTAKSEQFCGLSIECPGRFLCIVFQGTDDTLIGWKEDFRLASSSEIAAHKDAVKYLSKAVTASNAPKIYVCGHSKGGNLSLFSAVNSDKDIRDRITTAVSFDGPGFRDEFFSSENYREMRNRLVTVISDYSTIGLLLKLAGRRVIVKSDIKGPMAHDGFYWEVMGPKFIKTKTLSPSSRKFEHVLDDILLNMDEKTRLSFTEELFDILLSSGAKTITELTQLSLKDKTELLKKLSSNPQLSAFIRLTIASIFNLEP
ncbi:MAG: DUF2974 domain-containing protein [Lachnospiraceae bacterium]|nr:DUF2974 domain-containing protein [Lachnospiraceae bacterium]